MLKIDMSFVRDMLKNNTSHAIVETVISTAHIFDMQTLAEGIENAETADALLHAGCQQGQGYFYSKPLNLEEFINYLTKEYRHESA